MRKSPEIALAVLLITAFSLFAGELPLSAAREQMKDVRVSKTVYISKTGKKYHCYDCHHLKSVIPINLQDARLGGYEPCKVCQPG